MSDQNRLPRIRAARTGRPAGCRSSSSCCSRSCCSRRLSCTCPRRSPAASPWCPSPAPIRCAPRGGHRRQRRGRTRATPWPAARTLFVVRSSSASDRTADRRTLEIAEPRPTPSGSSSSSSQYRGSRRGRFRRGPPAPEPATYLERLIKSKTRRLARHAGDRRQLRRGRPARRTRHRRGASGSSSMRGRWPRKWRPPTTTSPRPARTSRGSSSRRLPASSSTGRRAAPSRRRWSATASAPPRISRDPVSSSDSGVALSGPLRRHDAAPPGQRPRRRGA